MDKTANNYESNKSIIYQIKIKEKLDESWTKWFGEMTMTFEKDNDGNQITVLAGSIVDQTALNGLLNKIWNLNLTVLSVEQINQ